MIAVIYIDPWTKTVEEIQLPNDKHIADAIDCEHITGVQVNKRLFMYLNDIGALPPNTGGPKDQRFFRLNQHDFKPTPYGGYAVVTGLTPSGATKSVGPDDLAYFKKIVEWLDIHPVDVGISEGWILHPVHGRMWQIKKDVIFAKGRRKQKA